MADDEATWDGFKAVVDLLSATPLPLTEQLFVLQLAWLALAGNARDQALAFPDGFPAEQARQLEQLDAMIRLVRDAAPDVEAERLFQEGDAEGYVKHMWRGLRTEKGGA